MQAKAPLLRSRTANKMIEIKLDDYKPRDWEYQNTKYMIRPQFALGHSKKRVKIPSEKEFKIFVNVKKSEMKDFLYKRELKPAQYRSYILSQIATLPGAVKVEESKIRDDKRRKDLIKVFKNKNLCYLNKMENDYASNVGFLPGSRDKEIEKGKLFKLNTVSNFNFKPKKKVEQPKTEKENEKVTSPIRDRIKRNKKEK